MGSEWHIEEDKNTHLNADVDAFLKKVRRILEEESTEGLLEEDLSFLRSNTPIMTHQQFQWQLIRGSLIQFIRQQFQWVMMLILGTEIPLC